MKKLSQRIALPVLALTISMVACSLGGIGSGSGNSTGSSRSSSGSGSSSSYGSVPLPTDTVDLQSGQVYNVGQAIQDPQSGVIFDVTSAHEDSTLPGLNAGETYALIDITLGNAGTDTVTSSSLTSYVVTAQGSDQTYGESHLFSLTTSDVLTTDKIGANITIWAVNMMSIIRCFTI